MDVSKQLRWCATHWTHAVAKDNPPANGLIIIGGISQYAVYWKVPARMRSSFYPKPGKDTSEEVNISLQRRGLNNPPKFFFLTYLLLIHRPSYMCRSCGAF